MVPFKSCHPSILFFILIFLCLSCLTSHFIFGEVNPPDARTISTEKNISKGYKDEAIHVIEDIAGELNRTAKTIWKFAEIALHEKKSSKQLARLLEENGFSIDWGAGNLDVAFVAVYGSGHPVIGILGEYDALPGLSQKAGLPYKEPIEKGAPGHGCGHNLFGVAGAGSAIALKVVMARHHLKGTVKFFGCPAEETVEGKVYMAKEGVFNGLDICFDWHPSSKNRVSLETSNALNNFEVTFRGKTSHAAGDPWNGRSALDAIELLDMGINFLREHVRPTVRMHYVIPEAGLAPNVVPDHARGWYYVRGKDRKEVDEVYQRVVNIVKGAGLMTDTKPKIHIFTGVYNYLKNKTVAELLHQNLQFVGPPAFDPEDQRIARLLQKNIGEKEEGMSTEIEPFSDPEGYSGGGSTDAADVSWLVPTASLNVACWPLNAPGHSWCITSFAGCSTGFKGMCTAAKVLACSGIDVLMKPSIIEAAGKEFRKKTEGFIYKSAIPKDQKPRSINQ